MPTNLSRSEFVKDFFKAKPGDKQLDAYVETMRTQSSNDSISIVCRDQRDTL